ncbi:MAG: DUF1559 domain-containing protein [Isosphaeraceae bacterium]|nr:DUF1559 domain-containing protein [Isosphaeraceae bacterium]
MQGHPRPRRGFTLIELLVVIAIIGVLVALLLPAVQAAREAARRAQCLNNLKQIGIAMHNYADSWGGLPPGGRYPDSGRPEQYHGWGTMILPYLEQANLFNSYNYDISFFEVPNQTAVNTQLGIYLCPSAGANRRVTGLYQAPVLGPSEPGWQFDPTLTAMAGDYFAPRGYSDPVWSPQQPQGEGALPWHTVASFAEFRDGTSNTLVVVERAGRPEHWAGGKRRDLPTGSFRWNWWGPWASYNYDWFYSYKQDGLQPYGPCTINCSNQRGVYSFHPSGANALFADGSVRHLKVGLSVPVFYALLTKGGGEVLSADSY